jgi:hypothetical protein
MDADRQVERVALERRRHAAMDALTATREWAAFLEAEGDLREHEIRYGGDTTHHPRRVFPDFEAKRR